MKSEKRGLVWGRGAAGIIALAFFLAGWCGVALGQGIPVWVREPFEQPNQAEGRAGWYGATWVTWQFLNDKWTFDHMPTGAYDGSGCLHIVNRGNGTDYYSQYTCAWGFAKSERTWKMGDHYYVRFRIRYDDDFRWVGAATLQNKLILVGSTGVKPQSRALLLAHSPATTVGLSLGFLVPPKGGKPTNVPADYGMPEYKSWEDEEIKGRYGSLSIHENISWNGAGPVLVTYGNNPKPPVAGPNSAAPKAGDCWYHMQYYVKSDPEHGVFKIWGNNNKFEAPTVSNVSRDPFGVSGWGGLMIGGYYTRHPNQNNGFRISDLEMGPEFDPKWYPEETQKKD